MATNTQTRKRSTKKVSAKKTSAKSSTTNIENSVNEAIEDVKQEASSLFATLKSNIAELQDVARQAWLAGLGIMGKSYDSALDSYAKLSDNGSSLVRDLIARGEKFQDEAEARFDKNRADIEGQIETARNQVTELASVIDISGRLQDISDRLEAFSKDLKKSA